MTTDPVAAKPANWGKITNTVATTINPRQRQNPFEK
jgi:hypothetical protein